jgi:hypothetical protein
MLPRIRRPAIALAAVGAVFGVAFSAAAADPPRGLPGGWSMLEDAPYAQAGKRWAYRAPAPRRGVYAHGASGDAPQAPDMDSEMGEKCGGPPPSPGGPRAEEYWYFEAGSEGLLLLKTNMIAGYDSRCDATIASKFTIERVVIGSRGFTRFVETASGWSGETHQSAEYRRATLGDIGIGNSWSPLERFVMRKRRLGDGGRGDRIGKVPTRCIVYSSPPDAGGGQCWDAGPGPGKGIVTFDFEIFAGSQYVHHALTDLEDGVAIDGRLFEWDRPIRNRGMVVSQ